MKDDIKEILRTLKSKSTRYEYCLKENISYNDESYEGHLLLDYITNLQQENQRLLKKSYKDDVTITKAIELIKRSAGYKGICTQPETDTFSLLLEILGGKENE